MIYLEPRSTFDKAIIIETDDCVVYDYELIINVMMIDYEWDYIEALEWYDRNIEPLIHYHGLLIRDCDDK